SQILDAYVNHQLDVVTRQTTYDLQKAKEREHIVDGLINAISILDELIQTIRASKNKANAQENILAAYQLSHEQADAILALQLYRLTNTDNTQSTEEKSSLQKHIAQDQAILADPKKLLQTIKKDLRQLKKQYA